MTAVAGQCDLIVDQGADWSALVKDWKDDAGVAISLSGYTAKMQIRANPNDLTALITLDSTVSGISINTGTNIITLSMTAAQTGALTFSSAWYDLMLTSGAGVVTRLIFGRVILRPRYTR